MSGACVLALSVTIMVLPEAYLLLSAKQRAGNYTVPSSLLVYSPLTSSGSRPTSAGTG